MYHLHQYHCWLPCMHLAKLHSTLGSLWYCTQPYSTLFDHIHFCFTWYNIVLTGLFFCWVFFILLKIHLHVSCISRLVCQSRFIHCTAEVSAGAAACSNTTCVCVCVCLGDYICVCQQKFPSVPSSRLAEPTPIKHVNLDKCFMSQQTHTTFLLQESLCQTHEDSVPIIVAMQLSILPLYCGMLFSSSPLMLSTAKAQISLVLHSQWKEIPKMMQLEDSRSRPTVVFRTIPFCPTEINPVHLVVMKREGSMLVGEP